MERGLLPCVYKVTYLGSLWYHHRHPMFIQHSLHQLQDWGYTEQIYWAAAPVRALQGKSGWPMAGVSIPLHLQPQGINQASGFSLFFLNFVTLQNFTKKEDLSVSSCGHLWGEGVLFWKPRNFWDDGNSFLLSAEVD